MKEIFEKGGKSTELVIVLHGLHGSPKTMMDVSAAIRDAKPDADILSPPLPFGGPFGFFAIQPAECVAAKVVERIDAAVEARNKQGGAYERIVLIGHSFGGVIARKVAIIAHGEHLEAVFEPRLREFKPGKKWAGLIERMVMLGGMSRGWSPSAARDWVTATFWSIGSWCAELIAFVTAGQIRPTVAGIRQGAPFIVQTRLQWLALTRFIRPSRHIAVIQLLGAIDDLVAPDDSVDFSCDLDNNRSSESFALVELPATGHRDAYKMSAPTDDQKRIIGTAIANGNLSEACIHYASRRWFQRRGARPLIPQTRWYIFQRVVLEPVRHLHDIRINPEHMTDRPALRPDKDVTNVVFVIHGIRDHGFWTQKIARVIKQQVEKENHTKKPGEQRLCFRSFTGSYGYFAIVPFVLPWIRRWKAEWLMDQYVEARAQYPNAAVSFVGHSNGTYLLSRALRDYPAVYFDRAVLAGSVIRKSFDWVSRLPPVSANAGGPIPQIREVLNYVATRDWVVGILSKAFQIAGPVFDLGSAGHDGFDQYQQNLHDKLHESHFVKGAHSAALVETQWSNIARFIIKGAPVPGSGDPDFKTSRNWLIVAAGFVSTLLLALFLAGVIYLGVALTRPIFADGIVHLDWRTGGRAAVSALYWWLVYIVASRF